MTKQEFYAASQPSNLQIVNKDMYGDESLIITGISFDDVICKYGRTPIKFTTPIIRPLDSLTKECVQADYNEGKPFIPIVELLKTIYPIKDEYKGTIYEIIDIDRSGYPRAYYRYLSTRDIIINPFDVNSMPHWVVQQLLRWHFWPNMPEGEDVIYVTETFNPYK